MWPEFYFHLQQVRDFPSLSWGTSGMRFLKSILDIIEVTLKWVG